MELVKATGEFFRELLDTHGRIATLATIIIACGGGSLVAAIAQTFLHAHGLFPWALGLLAFGLLTMVGAIYVSKNPTSEQLQLPSAKSAAQIIVQGMGLEPNVQAVEDMYTRNNGQCLKLVETHFQRISAYFADAAERERFLLRLVSSGALVVMHDGTWRTILRSQIDLLHELNTKALSLDQAKKYYDAAVTAYPDKYSNYLFEGWLAYLRSQEVILQSENIIQITIRGKDFLRWIVQEGHDIKNRLY